MMHWRKFLSALGMGVVAALALQGGCSQGGGIPEVNSAIGLSPDSLTFSAVAGGSDPAFQTVDLENSGIGTLNWTVSDDAVWLSVAPNAGATTTETDVLAVNASAAGLTVAGSPYTGIITVSDAAANNSPQAITVTLIVNPTGPVTIGLSTSSLAFTAVEAGPDPAPQTVDLTNTGGGTLNWTVTDDAVWLSVSPNSGDTTVETDMLTVNASIAGLNAAGSPYTGTITISDPAATNDPQIVVVTLNVTP